MNQDLDDLFISLDCVTIPSVRKEESLLNDVKEVLRKNVDANLSLTSSGSDLKTRRGLQHFTYIKFEDRNSQKIYDFIMSHALQAEKKCPGSGLLFVKKISGCVIKADDSLPRTKEDVVKILRKSGMNTRLLKILETSLDYCSSNSKITIKKSSSSSHHVEMTEGYTFQVKPLLKSGYLSLSSPRICCIDGFVENVSEIHMLLTELSEKKEPCILFLRGASDDVVHTLKVNFDRKTVTAIPFVVPYDLDNVNTIVDIAVVAGTDVISSTKGNLISSVALKDLGRVDSCIISGGELRISSATSRSRVHEHLKSLKEQAQERSDIVELLSKRIRSLTASCIDIHLPDDINFYSSSQQLDEGIRIISSVINNTYDPYSVAESTLKSFEEAFKNTNLCLL